MPAIQTDFQISSSSVHTNLAATNGRRIEDRIPIRFLLAADTIFARVYHHLTVVSPSNLPESGPGILVCNHTSSIDPGLIQSVCRSRLITWMMAKEYLEVKSMAWVFKTVGIIPVERTGRDSGSLRAALRALQNGAVLGIFPEGKIGDTPELLPFQTGAALMAIKTKTPVFPVYLDGTQRGKGMLKAALIPNRAKIAFGAPLILEGGTSREELEAATARIKAAIEELAEQMAMRVPTG